MKKTVRLLGILLAAMLMLSSCSNNINGGSHVGDDYLYVKGTATWDDETKAYKLASADITIGYNDVITDDFVPVESIDGNDPEIDNVFFRYENYRSYFDITTEAKAGFVFEEWKVRRLEDLVDVTEDYTYEYRKAKEGIEEAERYLNKTNLSNGKHIQNRYSPILKNLDADILPYIYAEYNRAPIYLALIEEKDLPSGTEWKGNGSQHNAYSLDQFRKIYRNSKEINIIVTETKDTNSLSGFLAELRIQYPNLEEIHLTIGYSNNYPADVSLLSTIPYVHIDGMEIDNLVLTKSKVNTNWKFSNCKFKTLDVKTDDPIVLERCTWNNLWKTGKTNVIER